MLRFLSLWEYASLQYYIQILEISMNQESYHSNDPSRSRGRTYKQNNSRKQLIEHQYSENVAEVKSQNVKLKKMLKEAQAKRVQITKQCSQLSKTVEMLEQQNQQLKIRVKQQASRSDGQKYRWEELKFLNKQLASEIEELRNENEALSQKLRYSSDVLERKYQQLQEKSQKRMEHCIKRVKKSIHYLESLSAKNLEKTREDLIDNLKKSIEVLRGKYNEELNCEGQIEQLMNPLKTMQEQILVKTKESNHFKQENIRLLQQITKYKSMQKQQIPMFKQAIQKLKKNLGQVRSQLSQNQYEKLQIKKKYEEKLKEGEYKYNELFKQCRKIKLQKKIYQNKLEQLQADVEQQKQRLLGENQMLKKLYQNNEDSSSSRISQMSNYKVSNTLFDKKTQQKKIKKNYSTNQLKTSNLQLKSSLYRQEGDKKDEGVQISDYNEESSMLSQQNLKQEICRIDEEIMEIQRNLNKELEAYK